MAENKQRTERGKIPHIKTISREAINRIKQTSNNPNHLSGLKSGFDDLDKITHGWQSGDLVVISARPSMGKTAFILSMALNMAKENIPVGIFSIEQTFSQLTNRLISNCCEIPMEKLATGTLLNYEWEQLDYKIKDLQDLSLYINCPARLSIESLSNDARKLVKEYGVKAIFVDYLQLLTVSEKYPDRYNEVNHITRELKALAKELDITFFAISQMNRENEKRQGAEGKRPQLTDLRDSGTICEDADIVYFIHRPEYYKILEDDKGNDLRGLAEIIIAKHRNGDMGDVLLRFKRDFCRFENFDYQYNTNYFRDLQNLNKDNKASENNFVPF